MITLYCISDVWKQAINICPFTTKVELFMKINKIDYKKNISLFNVQTSPTSNVPWIEHNNNKISESDNIIEYIRGHYKEIDEDMNSRNSQSKSKKRNEDEKNGVKTRKKRQELSLSAVKTIKKENVEIEVTFE